MLMNNLDPDVAEKPGELVVYGGIGRAARDWQSFDGIVAALRKLEADETLLVQSGKPVGVFRTHADAPRVPDRQFQPGATLGHLGAFQRARPQGPDDVRPDDSRLLDLYRQPGHRAGHLRDFRRDGPPALRRQPGRPLDSDRGPRWHGGRAADGRDHGGCVVPGHRMPSQQHRVPSAHRLCRCTGARPRRCAGDHRQGHDGQEAVSVALLGQRRRRAAGDAAPRRAAGLRHRSDLRARSGERLSAEGLDAG